VKPSALPIEYKYLGVKMKYRRLGNAGIKVSLFSIGSWVTYGSQVQDDTAKKCIHTALDHGVNFIDNAEAYAQGEAEITVGKIISGMKRSDLVISSKVFWGGNGPNERGLSRKHVVEACNAALKRLQTDYLDLYFCHRPDPETPIEETAITMDMLIRQGKVLYWGTSEWSYEQLQQAYDICDRLNLIKPTMEQPQYNLFHRKRVEEELVPHYEKYGLGTTIWSPLASGLLTGKYNIGIPEGSRASLDRMAWLKEEFTPDKIDKVTQLQPIAQAMECSLAQLALAWCAKNPYVSTVITGASRPSQVIENMKAMEVYERLDAEIMALINTIFRY
jgi:voltage-dependent potassium channel beta subunit